MFLVQVVKVKRDGNKDPIKSHPKVYLSLSNSGPDFFSVQ